VSKEVWKQIQDDGQKELSTLFANLVAKTDKSFISAIRDLRSPQASFYDGKLLLVGDAMVLARPHSGLSTNQVASQALALEEVVRGKVSVEEWEKEVLRSAYANHALSNAFGAFLFTGKTPDAAVQSVIEKEV
jgi:2-polyprenyl-6-methoxyphenol hydroxylase-like FAD-dependent oxidoreductase